ncbi:hypothetical protein OAL86_07485, partial [Verrucomicrobia bacterium]|nr:hypothetical protein [Verrucomicrobiota bacterium]
MAHHPILRDWVAFYCSQVITHFYHCLFENLLKSILRYANTNHKPTDQDFQPSRNHGSRHIQR